MNYLFHYTSEAGLRGIVKEKTFRLFSSYTANDPKDRTHGEDCVEIAIEQCSQSDGWIYELKEFERRRTTVSHYTMSFCKATNLFLWNKYGHNHKGFAIVVNEDQLTKFLKENGGGIYPRDIMFSSIQYGYPYQYIVDATNYLASRYEGFQTDSNYRQFLYNLINATCAGSIKCCVWEAEKEYRLRYVDIFEQTIISKSKVAQILNAVKFGVHFENLKCLGLLGSQRSYLNRSPRRYYYSLQLKNGFSHELIPYIVRGSESTLSTKEIRKILDRNGLMQTEIFDELDCPLYL